MDCENCGIDHDGSYGSGRFCSSKCARSFSSNKTLSVSKDVNCIVCGDIVTVDSRASGERCKCDGCRKQPKWKNRPGYKKRNYELSFCEYCGTNKKNRNRFCSTECKCKSIIEEKNKDIIRTNGVGGYGIKTLKRFLISTRGHKCVICNCDTWMGEKIPLVLDHINGRASDDRLENLRLVCGNCDMQLPTYKSKNKNSDRRKVKAES